MKIAFFFLFFFFLGKTALTGDIVSSDLGFLLMAAFSVQLVVLLQASYLRDGRYVLTCQYSHAGI